MNNINIFDFYDNVFGGLSILLESDAVIAALGKIPAEPGVAGSSMADILTTTATSVADLRAEVEKVLRGERP